MQLHYFTEDHAYCSQLADRLDRLGFSLSGITGIDASADQIGASPAEGIVVDLGYDSPSAVDVVASLREAGHDQAIIVLSARDDWKERVGGFNAGADACLVKPAHCEEVAARIRAVIRRVGGKASNRLVCGQVELDLGLQAATLAGQKLDLTRHELRLLSLFMLNPNRALTHCEIRSWLYPPETDRSNNAIEVLIARLRRKIGAALLRTVRGVGYRLSQEWSTSISRRPRSSAA
jgi:DNA-binding response OmpR family regulator